MPKTPGGEDPGCRRQAGRRRGSEEDEAGIEESGRGSEACPDVQKGERFMNTKNLVGKGAKFLFFLCAAVSLLALLLITVYILGKGVPAIAQIGVFDFLFGQIWQPQAEVFGIFPMIVATIYTTVGAVALGVPVGLMTAIFLSEMAPKWMVRFMRPAVELLAAIPSVVYGFFGLTVFVPFIDKISGGSGGNSMLAAILILAIMILPTITSTAEKALLSVPDSYREGSLGLGATKMQTIFHVTVPAARSGIFSGVVLGVGRAVGETMAVILVAGNAPQIPVIKSLATIPQFFFTRIRTLTANCALEMKYASGLHADALLGTAVVLFVFIMIINIVLTWVNNRKGDR